MLLPPLLRLSFWFNAYPQPFTPWMGYAMLVTFCLLLVLGIVGRIIIARSDWDKLTRKTWRMGSWMLVVLGCFGLLLYAFTYERVYILGARAWYLLWVLLLAWEVYRLWKFTHVTIPAMKKVRAVREQINKWLPKGKR